MSCAWPVAAGEHEHHGDLTELADATVFVASEVLADPAGASSRIVKVCACAAHLEQAKALLAANGLHGLSIGGGDRPSLHVPAPGEWPPKAEGLPLDD